MLLFQSIDPKQLVAPNETQRLAQLERFRLKDKEYLQLANVAGREGLAFLSTPFYLGAVEFLDPLVPAFKISSGDNDFIPLLKAVAKTRKPILLSTGMSDLSTIAESVRAIDTFWRNFEEAEVPGIALLHCVSSYPTAMSDANIGFLKELASLGHVLGYSDHTIGTEAVSLAIALGARVVEKHFTLDKNFSDFRDHQLSCDPDEMKVYCETIRNAETLQEQARNVFLPVKKERTPPREDISLRRWICQLAMYWNGATLLGYALAVAKHLGRKQN